MMIKNITIENFRGLSSLEINDMTRVTLISGKNNIGKSSILEALFLMMDHAAVNSFGLLSSFRNSPVTGTATLWGPLFPDLDTDRIIRISIVDESKWSQIVYKKDTTYLPQNVNGVSEDTLVQFRMALKNNYALSYEYDEKELEGSTYAYHELGHFSLNSVGSITRDITSDLPGNELKAPIPTLFLNSSLSRSTDNILNIIGRYELEGKKDEVIDIIKELDSSIEDIVTVSYQGITQLYLKTSGKLIPLQYAGDGTVKLLNICLAIQEMKNGLVLIDELDTGFHYSMYGKLWSIIEKTSSKSNCQVIATTHSYELISAVSSHFSDRNVFSYYRMGHSNDNVAMFRYDFELLDHALASDMEVR